MKIINLIAISVSCSFLAPAFVNAQSKPKVTAKASQDFVHHPAPKDPIFLDPAWYPELKKAVTPPPAKNSPEQKSDEVELRKIQASRTAADCDRAKSEVLVSLKSFYGGVGSLDDAKVAKLTGFFEQLRNDADYFIQKLKVDFPRKRPFSYMLDLKPCVPKEVTDAYPSGHAVISKIFELVLSDLYPQDRSAFAARGKVIGDDRVLVGMHHPSDVASGRKIGELIYAQFQKSKKYVAHIKSIR